MRSVIVALCGVILAGSHAGAQPLEGRLKTIQETATVQIAYRTDSRPFAYVDAGKPAGYTIDLCERVTKSLEQQLGKPLTIKWVQVDTQTRFEAIASGAADMECGSTTMSLSRMTLVDFSSIVFAE